MLLLLWYLFLYRSFNSTLYSVCVPLPGCRNEYVFLPVAVLRLPESRQCSAKICFLFQISKEKEGFFLLCLEF